MDKALHTEPDLKTDTESDLVETSNVVAECTFTSFKDTFIFDDNGHKSSKVCLGRDAGTRICGLQFEGPRRW